MLPHNIHVSESENLKVISRIKQECIPVGCVPTAAVAISGRGWGGGGYLVRG